MQLCYDYVYHRLQCTYPAIKWYYPKFMQSPTEIQEAIRDIGSNLRKQSKHKELVKVVHEIQSKDEFYEICGALFKGGISWGRIMAIFELAALIAIKNVPDVYEPGWLLAVLLYPKIKDFVLDFGGWETLKK